MEPRRFLEVEIDRGQHDHVSFVDCDRVRHTFEVVDGALVIYRETKDDVPVALVPYPVAAFAPGQWYNVYQKMTNVREDG